MGAFGETFPLLAPPRLGADERVGAGAHCLAGQQFARREDEGFGEVAGAALIVNTDGGESIHFVAPQVDTNGHIGCGREHVDDGTASGDLAAVLNDFLTAVATGDQGLEQLFGIDDGTRVHTNWLDVYCAGTESLQQRTHAGHDDGRATLRVA
ncbi:unannotated protein [freshwater metagenome]|uniref:Unannotated protein n=1 Tax=freshwater metagenome TaxID=449393 RepID=A0A6J6PWV9_9ZZZZ